MTTLKRFLLSCSISAATLMTVGVHAASAATTTPVSATYQTLIPALLTSYQPSATDPLMGTYEGVGSTLWQGTWAGVTTYQIRGTANLITGAGEGTLDEVFYGRAVDGTTGTLSFAETYTLDARGIVRIDCTIVGATGGFAGATGHVVADGVEISVVTGYGTITGTWTH